MVLSRPLLSLDDGSKHRVRALGLGDIMVLTSLIGQAARGNYQWALLHSWLDTFAPARPLTELGDRLSLPEYGRLLEALGDHPEVVIFAEKFAERMSTPPEKQEPSDKSDTRKILHLVQAQYGWADSYLVNDPWSPGDYLSYTRWLEVVETVCEAVREEKRFEMQQSCLVGYQNYLMQPKAKGARVMTLERWYKAFGVDTPRRARGSRAELIAKANANFERYFGKRIRKAQQKKASQPKVEDEPKQEATPKPPSPTGIAEAWRGR